ncbi:hypothetical protein Glove_78g65 [Diversispora epigaea]|uniref:non-specific serine/threonine protein kinase n=1 Tax=Diversispora epigaea TaxID=1348612 RepID=A0A397J8R3_9GLOM|nr:hypothetical protein Glove_78g65 [Diversispora epigaea]
MGNIYKGIVTPSPELNSATAMEKQNFQDSYQDTLEHDQETPRLLTIVEGRKIDVANYQSKPHCVVEFEQHEVVTKETIKQYMSRDGRSIDFLDIERAANFTIQTCNERTHGRAQSEIFLGMLKIQPPRYPNQIVGGKEIVTGEVHVQISYEEAEVKGNSGKIFQVRKKDTNRIYATKDLQKQDLIERSEVENTLSEKNILTQAGQCPLLVGLNEERAKFYVAEIDLALEHLHRNRITNRCSSAVEVQSRLQEQENINISALTILRILRNDDRLDFARKYENWMINDWPKDLLNIIKIQGFAIKDIIFQQDGDHKHTANERIWVRRQGLARDRH